MDPIFTRRTLLCAGLTLPLFAGCGGGSGTAASNVAGGTRGTVTLTLNMPPSRTPRTAAKTRAAGDFIPLGTRAVQVAITDATTGAAVAPSQLITAPFANTTSPTIVTARFANVPVGSIRVQVTAFPDAAGQQTPLANGSATGQVNAGATTSLLVPLTLTLAKLSTSPDTVIVDPTVTSSNHTATITASALDGSNRTLNLPVYWLSMDPGVAQVTFDPANPTVATITGVSFGSATVVLVEPNSGMSATVDVTSGEL